jgi:hypothetical protein
MRSTSRIAGVVVAQLPGGGQFEKAEQRRLRQALAFGFGIQVNELGRLELAFGVSVS